MNNTLSRIIGSFCMLGVVVGIGWLLGSPIKARHEERLIAEARLAYDREASMQHRQQSTKAELDEEIAEISAEKSARVEELEALMEEKEKLASEVEALGRRREEVLAEMNDRALKNREAYVGREFEQFDPGNGKIYENVKVDSVSDEGIKLRNEIGLRTVRPEEVGDDFQIRFRFGQVPGDKPLPAKPAEPE